MDIVALRGMVRMYACICKPLAKEGAAGVFAKRDNKTAGMGGQRPGGQTRSCTGRNIILVCLAGSLALALLQRVGGSRARPEDLKTWIMEGLSVMIHNGEQQAAERM